MRDGNSGDDGFCCIARYSSPVPAAVRAIQRLIFAESHKLAADVTPE